MNVSHSLLGNVLTKRRVYTRKKPKQARSKALVEAVAEATILLIKRDGWANVTTEAVADRAGCSIGSLYQYFPNKEALLDELAERHIEEVQELVASFIAENTVHETTVSSLIHKLVTLIFDVHRKNPTLHRLLSEELDLPDDLKNRFEQFLEIGQQWLANWLQTNSLYNEEASIVAQLVIGTVDHAAHRVLILQDDEHVIKQTYTETIRMIERYVVAE